jgi:uncharacterized cupin superfamily protein
MLNRLTGHTMPGTRISSTALLLHLLCLPVPGNIAHAQPPKIIEAGKFSSASAGDALPAGWQPLTFSGIQRHTAYSLVNEGDTVVIKAASDRSASGLVHALSIDPADYPVIQWRWKIDHTLRKGDVTRKSGDDYPARIYITFAYDPDKAGYLEQLKQKAARLVYGKDVPYRAISYIWASNSPAGSMAENPYTARNMMFAVRGGDAESGQWVMERRNIHEDYRSAFGEEPTMISGVAIMTDTDNTGESVTAWYGDILFMSDPARQD